MKKALLIILSLALILVLVGGCNKSTPAETSESKPSEATNQTGDKPSEPAIEGDPNNDDLIGPDLGYDFNWKPIGYDLDTLIERVGKKMGGVENIKLGVNVNHLKTNWSLMWSEEYKRLAEKYGFELLLLSSDNDPAKDAANIKTFVSQECDAVIFYPANAISAIPALNAEKENIKILHYSTGGDFFGEKVKIVNDQLSKGLDLGNMVKEDANGEVRNILLIAPTGDAKYVDDRLAGVRKICDENDNMNVVMEIRTANIDESLNKVKEILLVNDEINTIVGVVTASMVGGYNAVEQLDMIDKIHVYGMDPDESMLDLITEGKISGMLCQVPQMSTYFSTFLAFRVINGDSMESIQTIPAGFDFPCRAAQVDQARSILFPNSDKNK